METTLNLSEDIVLFALQPDTCKRMNLEQLWG
jgi:hypothetical protein